MKEEKGKILITGGAGFIGSNLCEHFLAKGYHVVCMDNLSTGSFKNIKEFINSSDFEFIEADIRDLNACRTAVKGCSYVLHQAALGSVPRSINDPITTNEVNINGFLNMLVAARDEKVKRFVYAASSSTYGDSTSLPKIEENIGKPLSPYAITKYVNELYADVFYKTYGLESIGLRYFNVFGKKQDPNGAYAAVIPKFVIQLLNDESPIINGDAHYSRDFTFVDNVVQMNELAMLTQNTEAINQIYNTAFGENTTLHDLFHGIKNELLKFNSNIENINYKVGPNRMGDIPHSLASIEKAKKLLNYQPEFNLFQGLEKVIEWYYEKLKSSKTNV